ncbi:Early nodulin-like protein 1 precursor [Dorcoceras hygrometricum]|uniref:Early nodulin-like protein 1 n=1 Tax=Dorcoceras hygrometricum TaxID=472368 RepID=A0A2Z7BMH2_9LAMI|nr:Early nodulin-like protein 1 precursor [Dorcoceras hygrometricum]
MASMKTLIRCLPILLSAIFINLSEAREFVVGAKKKWHVPSSSEEFNKWAGKIRFQIGDSIELKYDSKTDSVLEVTEENYKHCNKINPIGSYSDGDTKITLYRSGPFYFISGADGHCEKGQKLEIQVMSANHSHPLPVAPAPSPADTIAPAPSTAGSATKTWWFVSCAVVVGILSSI